MRPVTVGSQLPDKDYRPRVRGFIGLANNACL